MTNKMTRATFKQRCRPYMYRIENCWSIVQLIVTGQSYFARTGLIVDRNPKEKPAEKLGYALVNCPPVSLWWRWMKLICPYLLHYHREPFYKREGYFVKAWRLVSKGNHIPSNMPLPVLNNTVDAPCEGCGGRCCHTPAETQGFSVVVVLPWEHFAKLHRDVLEPSPNTPGELYLKFDALPDKSYRCRFLSPEGSCTVHNHRPMACRAFSCTDGMSEYSSAYCGADFLRRMPEVKERLVSLGFKQVERKVTSCS